MIARTPFPVKMDFIQGNFITRRRKEGEHKKEETGRKE
jgi:hypothetical protein